MFACLCLHRIRLGLTVLDHLKDIRLLSAFGHDHVGLQGCCGRAEFNRLAGQLRHIDVLSRSRWIIELHDIETDLIHLALHADILYLVSAEDRLGISSQGIDVVSRHLAFELYCPSVDNKTIVVILLPPDDRRNVLWTVQPKCCDRIAFHRKSRIGRNLKYRNVVAQPRVETFRI